MAAGEDGASRALGVPKGTAVAALLLSMIGFYAAYALLAATTLVLLWLHDQATPLMAGAVTLFLVIAFAIPALALWLRGRGSRPLPPRLKKIAFIKALLDAVAQAPAELLHNRPLLARVTAFNALIFLADTGTLFVCLRSLGEQAGAATALIAYVMASIAVTLAPVPMGLGSFEATATATLHLLGVPVEAAFAGTMLLRLMTLWFPLLPGLFLLRGAMARRRPPGGKA